MSGMGLSNILSDRQFLSSLKFSSQALVHLNCTLFHVNSLSGMCHKLYCLEKGFYLLLSLGAFHALDVFNFYRICCHTLLQVDMAKPHKGLLTEIAVLFLKSDAIFM